MKKKLFRIFLWLFILFVLITGVVIFLNSYTPVIDSAILNLINSFSGDQIKVYYSNLEGNLFGNIKFSDVKIEYESFTIFTPTIIFNYSARNLLNGQIFINSLIIESPQFILVDNTGDYSVLNSESRNDSLPIQIDLSGMPDLQINNFILKNGRFIYRSNDQELSHILDINLETELTLNDKKADINLKYIKGMWQEKNMSLDQLSFRLIGNKKRLTMNQFSLIIDDNQIFAHGEIELVPELKFYIFADTSFIKIPLIKKIYPEFPFEKGFVKFYVDYIGIPSDFAGQFYLSALLDSLNFTRLATKYLYNNRVLNLERLSVVTNFGTVGGSVQIAPEGKNEIKLNFQNLNLHKISVTSSHMSLDGWLTMKFNQWDLSRISGEGTAQLTEISYGNMSIDTLYMNLFAENGYWILKQGSRLVIAESSKFFVQGNLSRDMNLDVELKTDDNNLDTLNQRLNLGNIGGLGSLAVLAKGPLRNPDISGYVLLDSLSYGDIRSYGVEGSFELKGISEEREGFFQLELSSGMIADILLTDGVVDLKIEQNQVTMDSLSFYNEDNYITMEGSINLITNMLDIKVDHLEFQYEDYRIFSSDTLQAFFRNDSIMIENFVLNATGDGEIEIRGMLDLEGNAGLGIYFKNIQLLPFNQFIQFPYEINGVIEISMILTGMADSLMIQSLVDIKDLMLAQDLLGNLQAEFSYFESVVEIEKFNFVHSTESTLNIDGRFKLPSSGDIDHQIDEQLQLWIEIENLNLSDYHILGDYNYPFTGNFSGIIDMEGTTSDFLVDYNFNIKDFQYKEYKFPRIDLLGFINPSAIVVRDGLINFMGTVISINGAKTIDWNYNDLENIFSDKSVMVNAKIVDDTIKFIGVLTPEVDILTGDISANMQIGGTIDNLKIMKGNLDISKGTLYLTKVENPLTEIEFNSIIDNQKLIIKKANASSFREIEDKNLLKSLTDFLIKPFRTVVGTEEGKGKLNLIGSVDFSILERPFLDLRLNADKLFINYYLENAKIVLSGNNFTIKGRDTLLFAGDVTIHEGEVDLDIEESEKNLLLSPGVREEKPYIQYRIDVEIPANFYIRSEALFNSFDMMLTGELKILQEPKGLLEMYGTLDVPKGSYFQFEEFSIRDGRIAFVNPKEIPQLNILAEKKKYGYTFQLHVEGTLNNPIKEIRIIDMQTREDVTHLYPETKDQIALLLFGMTFNELGGSAGAAALDKGQEVINQAIISRIEQEARRFIGLDEIRVESERGIVDFTNLRLNQISQGSTISLGKYIMPSLYLEYRTQLGSTGVSSIGNSEAPSLNYEVGNQIYLEYQINRNWSVSSFYARQLYDKFKIDISWRYNF